MLVLSVRILLQIVRLFFSVLECVKLMSYIIDTCRKVITLSNVSVDATSIRAVNDMLLPHLGVKYKIEKFCTEASALLWINRPTLAVTPVVGFINCSRCGEIRWSWAIANLRYESSFQSVIEVVTP